MNREELIDKIIRGEKLSEAEALTWADIKDDPSVKEELSLMQQLDHPLKIVNRKLLKDQLKGIETTIGEEQRQTTQKPIVKHTEIQNPQNKISRLPTWLYAAAGLLLLAAVTFLMRPQNQVDYFASHYEAYPSIVNPILKGTDNSSDKINQGYIAYQNKDYQRALTLFELATSSNDTIKFYQAISLIETKKPQQAIALLKDLQNRDNRFQQEAAWYKALCQLKIGNREAAISGLSKIEVKHDHPFNSEAVVLLRLLK